MTINILGHALPGHGCGNHCCHVIKVPAGCVGTNGGCSCLGDIADLGERVKVLKELRRLGYPKKGEDL